MTSHQSLYIYNAPTLIVSPSGGLGHDITIQNNGSADLFIGAAGVNSEDFGFRVVPNTAISFELDGQDSIYAYCDSSTLVSIMRINLERVK